MEDENETKDRTWPHPIRDVTINQVVAWNMAWWRKRAGLTQAQLGEKIGWTNAAVSEAERSWDSGRTREFDAHLMLCVATALGVPMTALLLPPEDAGAYAITLDGGTTALVEHIMPDLDAETAVLEAYRAQVHRAAVAWLAPDWAADVARLLGTISDKEFAAVTATRLRAMLTDAGRALEELGKLADQIEDDAW